MSRLPFEFFLALRYLRPKRTFVSVITFISVLGVTLGVAVLIIVISVMTGFDKQLKERLLGFDSHMKIFQRNLDTSGTEPLDNWQDVLKLVKEHPDVVGVAPTVLSKVMIETQPDVGSGMIEAPIIRGIAPEFEATVSDLMKDVVYGKPDLSGHSMIMGIDLASLLRVREGDRVAVYSHHALRRMKESKGEEIVPAEDFLITGIFDAGMWDYNYNVVAMSLGSAQDLMGMDGSVSALTVKLTDPMNVSRVLVDLQMKLGAHYRITTWMQENSVILTALQVEKNMMFYILFFIMIVAAFGIMNSQITFVVQKTREIGMLKALGTSRLSIVVLFLTQSFVVGVFGVSVGFGMGILMLKYRNEFLDVMNRWTGLELFPASTYQFSRLPAVIDSGDITIICGSALIICVLAGVIPAWTAARLRPVQALRND
jgi:lipoprotein-releasing system permease protein